MLRYMVSPAEFLDTIYLGDRGCKSILIDSWARQVKVQVDRISRVIGDSWDYNSSGDIVDGLLVFSDVVSISLNPPGPLPNDFIHHLAVVPVEGSEGLYCFILEVGTAADDGSVGSVSILITARSISLEDPRNPGVSIGS